MKNLVLILVLFVGFSAFSQSRQQILNELRELLKSQGSPSELFYVESEGFLDIQGHQVKLYWARMRYEESDGPMLGFYCSTNCIYNPKTNETMSNFAFRMKNKEGVYKAIDLINQIENAAGENAIETGDPNASGYYGIGSDGSGGNYNLGNRRALTRPIPEYDCNEEGKVVVTISVDPSGKVISAQPGATGTTNSASCLLNRAKEAALRTRFNADSNAPATQVGLIIYNFSLSE
jgi:hypothetical protein